MTQVENGREIIGRNRRETTKIITNTRKLAQGNREIGEIRGNKDEGELEMGGRGESWEGTKKKPKKITNTVNE